MIDKAFMDREEKCQIFYDKHLQKHPDLVGKHGRDLEDSDLSNFYHAGYKQLATEINIILEEEPIVYNFIGRIIPKIKEILADTELKESD